MDSTLIASADNLISPPVLFFALGLIMGILRTDLKLPGEFSKILSVYLMMAIGFKGGIEIAEAAFGFDFFFVCLMGLSFSLLLPFLAYFLLGIGTKLKAADRIGVATHYGSVSVITFVTGLSFLDYRQINYESYMLFVLVLMEAPALISAQFLKTKVLKRRKTKNEMSFKDVFLTGSIVLLLGSLLIGAISGTEGKELVEDFLITPFKGVLCLFLLDMGISAGQSLSDFKQAGWRLIAFGLYMAMIGGLLGVSSAHLLGVSVGGATLFGILTASASYIVIPAALRISLPEANSAIYAPLTLGITFPFNVILGIPIYYSFARLLAS